jgi:hypothetical protein
MKIIGMLIGLLALSSLAFGQPADVCLGLPDDATEVEVWEWNGTSWVPIVLCDPCAKARLFASGGIDCACNKKEWLVNVDIYAHVAQWIDFYVTGTRWDWLIMKPGIYGGDCITFEVKSNGDVLVDYDGFDDLYSADACEQYIPIWYAYGQQIGGLEWIRSYDLDDSDDLIEEICPGHTFQTKLWSRVEVVECNTACDYYDAATIKLILQNQKLWVDDDGSWCDKVDVCADWGCETD